MIIKAANNRVFRRIHDGFIMGNEIVLGKDYSTGIEREDLPEYYEEVLSPDAPTPPTPTGLRIAIPADWEIFFPEDRFIVGPFDIELERIEGTLAVDIAYLGWEAFREELLKPEHASLARHMGTVMRYLEIQKIKKNYI
jgi:hypothetical protein